MKSNSAARLAVTNAAFTLLAGMGILIAIFGIGLDFLFPYTSPGFNFPQLLLVISGLTLSLVALALRREARRRRVFKWIGGHWVSVLLITFVTLIVLEIVLVALGLGTYYPTEIPQKWIEPVPWWRCDEAGCRYVYDELIEACDNGVFSGRRCIVNRQGYQDAGDFVALDDSDNSKRILMLGDSFTDGYSAEIGKSYVETIEANLPDSIVWNTAIGGTGTNHALASFESLAPLLRPQVTILGFYMNDFDDNVTPIDSYLEVVNLETNGMLMIKQYRVDVWGNVIKLDLQSDLYYRKHDVDPPASELKRIAGSTRLGSLVLRMVDALGGAMFSDARFERKVDLTREYLRELIAAAGEQGSAILVMLIPHEDNIDHVSQQYQTAIQLMRELEIPYLNPMNSLEASDYSADSDFHWNNAGHQKIGALLSACMETFYANGDFAECELVEAP